MQLCEKNCKRQLDKKCKSKCDSLTSKHKIILIVLVNMLYAKTIKMSELVEVLVST